MMYNCSIQGRFRMLPRGDSRGSVTQASLENTLVRFKPDLKNDNGICCQFMTTVHVQYMILKCANNSNYTIIELHDYINFTRCFNGCSALCMRAQYSEMSHGYDDGIPAGARFPGVTV